MRYLLIILSATFICTACVNSKKATNYMRDHKDVSSRLCAELYPVTADTSYDYVIDSSDYGKAIMEMTIVIDSLINNCHDAQGRIIIKDSLIRIRDSIIRTVIRTKPCIDSVKTVTVVKLDNAALTACSTQLANEHDWRIKAETARDVYKSQNKNKMWLIILLAVSLGISIFFHVKNLFKPKI